MKITLVQAPRLLDQWHCYPPFGIAILAGILKSREFEVFQKDFDVELFNLVNSEDQQLWDAGNAAVWLGANDSDEHPINRFRWFVDRAASDILKNDPDVVGFSTKAGAFAFSLAIASQVKKLAPKTYIVMGGPDCSEYPQRYITRPYVDAVAIGEADVSFLNFLEKLRSNHRMPQREPGFLFRDADGKIVDGGPILEVPDIRNNPFADYSDYDFTQYALQSNVFAMAFSRGCINRCSFCAESPALKKFRSIPADRIYAEIDHHLRNNNIASPPVMSLHDSLFNGDLHELAKLAEKLIRYPIQGLTYTGMMSLRRDMDDDLIVKLAQSGLRYVFVGLESGSEIVLQMMKKRVSLVDAKRIIRKCHENGISVIVSLVIGHPGESDKEFQRTLEFLREIKACIHGYHYGPLTIVNHTSDIAMHPHKYGVLVNDGINWVSEDGSNTPEVRAYRMKLMTEFVGTP